MANIEDTQIVADSSWKGLYEAIHKAWKSLDFDKGEDSCDVLVNYFGQDFKKKLKKFLPMIKETWEDHYCPMTNRYFEHRSVNFSVKQFYSSSLYVVVTQRMEVPEPGNMPEWKDFVEGTEFDDESDDEFEGQLAESEAK